MTKLDIINNLEKQGIFKDCIKSGLVSVSFLEYKSIYEQFLFFNSTHNKMTSYQLTADTFNISESSVRRIIKELLT